MYDKLAENESAGAIKLWEAVNRIFSTRAMTLIHGDLNAGIEYIEPLEYRIVEL
jgi:5-methylthioribose kinase